GFVATGGIPGAPDRRVDAAFGELSDGAHHQPVHGEGDREGGDGAGALGDAVDVDHCVADGDLGVEVEVDDVVEVLRRGMAGGVIRGGGVGVLAARDADQGAAAFLRSEGCIDEGGVDAVGVDEDQQVALPQLIVLDDDPAVAGGALDRHRAQGAAREEGALVEDGGDVHEAAGAEEHLLRGEVRVAAGAVDMDQAVAGDLVGEEAGPLGDGALLLGTDAVHEVGDDLEVVARKRCRVRDCRVGGHRGSASASTKRWASGWVRSAVPGWVPEMGWFTASCTACRLTAVGTEATIRRAFSSRGMVTVMA